VKIDNLLVRNNELMDEGKLDEQIIRDLEEFISREEEHKKYLNEKVKGYSNHYEEWMEKTKDKLTYAKRLLRCVQRMKGMQDGETEERLEAICESCSHSYVEGGDNVCKLVTCNFEVKPKEER